MTKIVITPSEVYVALQQDMGDGFFHTSGELLSNPAIQRLVVRKCVEGMSEEVFDRLYFQRLSTSPSLAEDRADLLAALCPPEQEEG